MVKLLFIVILFTSELYCQVLSSDSTKAKKDSANYFLYNSDLNFIPGNDFQINKINTLNNLYFLIQDSLFDNVSYFNYQNEPLPLGNTYSANQNLYNNTLEMKNYFRNFYLQSRPSTFQKIMYDVDFSGAVILAGYHVWKYYIKKPKK